MEESRDKGMIGGILSIISGAFGILYGIFFIVFMAIILGAVGNPAFSPGTPGFPLELNALMAIFYSVIGGGLALIGILAIVGGVFSLKRKHWGSALAGAIAAAITFFPYGIAAVIFVSLGRQEFLTHPLLPGQN